jgi:hypothetical protein
MGHVGDIKGPRGWPGETRIGPRPQAPTREGPRTPPAGTPFLADGMAPAVPLGEGTRILRAPLATPSQGTPVIATPEGGGGPEVAEPSDTLPGDSGRAGRAVLTDVPRGEGSRLVRLPLPPADAPRGSPGTPPGGPPTPVGSGPNTAEVSGNGTAVPPALGSGEPGPDAALAPSSPPAGEASPMSSFRIPSAIARLFPQSVGGGTGPLAVPKGGIPIVLDGAGRPQDNFRAQHAPPPGRPPLAGNERPPVKSVEELVPPDLEKVADQEELGHRFASDAALLAAHLKPSQLSGSERATRLWAFYAAYAEAAAGKPPQEEARAAFKEALEGHGFAELRDANSTKNGVEQGLWVLNARSPDEARERVASVRLEPPPEVRHSEAAARGEAASASADRPAEQALSLPSGARASEALKGMAVPVALESREAQTEEEDPEEVRKRARNRRLGPMMFWNVLHRFRSDEEDGAVAQAQWDRAAFGAMLALAAIALMVAALVSL